MAELLDNRVILLMQLHSIETDFMTELKYLLIEYWYPLKTIISSEEHQMLFGGIDCITKTIANYIEKMNNIDRNQTSISKIILSHYNQIQTDYINYLNNYPNSNKLLQHFCKNNAKFFNFCQNVHKNNKNTNNNNLSLLLQLPVVHIFKICNQISD
eukprot:83832_1